MSDIGSQEVPNWSEFQDPKALNIRTGIYYIELTSEYEVYLMDGNDQLFSKMFSDLQLAIKFLNGSILSKSGDTWKLISNI